MCIRDRLTRSGGAAASPPRVSQPEGRARPRRHPPPSGGNSEISSPGSSTRSPPACTPLTRTIPVAPGSRPRRSTTEPTFGVSVSRKVCCVRRSAVCVSRPANSRAVIVSVEVVMPELYHASRRAEPGAPDGSTPPANLPISEPTALRVERRGMLADDDIEAGAGPETAGADGAPQGVAAVGRDVALRAVQVALIKEIDAAIARLENAPADAATREHLEVLRTLLTAQVTAYLEHIKARRAKLFPHTSVMYAGDVAPPGGLPTTLGGLLEGGTLNRGQGARLAQLVSDRRTLLIFGERGAGKSTLLNSLFELVPVDDRFVAIEQGPDLPALKELSLIHI